MKLGFIGYNHLEGVEADSAFAAANGFSGLEYNYWGEFADLAPETVQAMRTIHQKHGVECCMLGIWGWNHLATDPAERARAHEMLDRAIGYAETLKAVTFVTGGGLIPGASIAQHVEEFAKVFPPIMARVRDAGMKMAFYAVHGQSFFESIEAYEAVWEQFPEVLIKYDPANWQYHGDDYIDVVRRHGDKVGHVHIKEHLNINGEVASQPAAGMGDVEFPKVLAFLYEHGYDGYLSMEPHGELWSQGALREKMLLLSKRYLYNFVL